MARIEAVEAPDRSVPMPDMLRGVLSWKIEGSHDGRPAQVTITLHAGEVEFEGVGLRP